MRTDSTRCDSQQVIQQYLIEVDVGLIRAEDVEFALDDFIVPEEGLAAGGGKVGFDGDSQFAVVVGQSAEVEVVLAEELLNAH